MSTPQSSDPLQAPSEHLLMFIGHADDADAEAAAIKALEPQLQSELRQLGFDARAAGMAPPLTDFYSWDWKSDAVAETGGQSIVVDPRLRRADIAAFVFRNKVGAVTWKELTGLRTADARARHVLAFFPEVRTDDMEHKRLQLSQGWSDASQFSLVPIDPYRDIEHLQKLALKGVKDAMRVLWRKRLSEQTQGKDDPSPDSWSDAAIGDAVAELAKVYTSQGSANVLLGRVSFPPEARPAFGVPLAYWQHVCADINGGRIDGTLDDLLAATKPDYPGNRYFKKFHRR